MSRPTPEEIKASFGTVSYDDANTLAGALDEIVPPMAGKTFIVDPRETPHQNIKNLLAAAHDWYFHGN